ncbi:MAG: C1 family peptidase [Bacteroidota bacterium]|nr:C1 family peptidase [Bacteroidota bacterium]
MKKLLTFVLFASASTLLAAQPATEPAITGQVRLTDSIACTSVKDQGQSPTCWVFGTNSLFESDLIKRDGTRLNLSEMFIARYAYIDKAKQFLATGGKTYFEGGGQFHDVIRVVNNYGMVPEEVYNGRPNKQFRHNHDQLDTAMKKITYQLLKEGKTELLVNDLRQMNDTLDKYLGKVPPYFTYKGKSYTPKTFAAEVVQLGNDYIELVSFADQPLYQQFILADKYNWANDSFYNITLDDMLAVTDMALQKGWSVGWEGDVTEDGFHYYSGYAAFADTARNYDEERLANYKTERIERDHMLQVAGAGKDENNKRWYYMKNSWGSFLSKYGGYLYMEENYFRLKTVILFVNKNAIPQNLKEKLGIQ